MILAQAGAQWLLPGLVLLAVMLLLRPRMVRNRRARGTGAAADAHRGLYDVEQSSAARVHQLEVRLHDYGREVEGRMEANLALLDRLIVEADQEIARLETLLEESRCKQAGAARPAGGIVPFPGRDAREPLNAEQRQMIRLLAQAGYTAEEVAQLVERAPEQVRAILNEPDHRPGAEAA